MRRALAISLFAFAAAVTACDPADRVPAKNGKCPPCPPPPEPVYQSVVVGTIGKMHMAESRYPLAKLGEVLTGFKPELVLIGARVDAFREDRLEDASFEMTYVSYLAKQHGAYVEPVDWFREQDFGAPPPAVEPWDAAEIVRQETTVLNQPRLYTFELANGNELSARILAATAASQRFRSGDVTTSRRLGWMQYLTLSSVSRHDRPKRVLAFVDVLDRPAIQSALHTAGYSEKAPADVISKAKEQMIGDVPNEVLSLYKQQLERAKERAEKTEGPTKAYWTDRAHVLNVVVDKRASCCVTQAALGPAK